MEPVSLGAVLRSQNYLFSAPAPLFFLILAPTPILKIISAPPAPAPQLWNLEMPHKKICLTTANYVIYTLSRYVVEGGA